MAQYTSGQLTQMFADRKSLEVKEYDGVKFVDFYVTAKQARWLESVRLRELGFPKTSKLDFIGAHDWAMSFTHAGAGQIRMTVDGSDVKGVLGPAVHITR